MTAALTYCLSTFWGLVATDKNRSFRGVFVKALLVLAGAEDGVKKSDCRVVKIMLVAYALDLGGRRSEQQLEVKCA